MRLSITSTLVLLAAVGQVTACQKMIETGQNNSPTAASQNLFRIAAQTVGCTKGGLTGQPIQAKCLVVNGETFYGAIDGYIHQEGVARTIKISRTQICDPEVFNSCPQDMGSIYQYRLVEIIS